MYETANGRTKGDRGVSFSGFGSKEEYPLHDFAKRVSSAQGPLSFGIGPLSMNSISLGRLLLPAPHVQPNRPDVPATLRAG